MPFKSQKQRAKFYAMAEAGKMPMSTVNEWQAATGKKKLPMYAEEKGEKKRDNEKAEKKK